MKLSPVEASVGDVVSLLPGAGNPTPISGGSPLGLLQALWQSPDGSQHMQVNIAWPYYFWYSSGKLELEKPWSGMSHS